MKTYGFTLVELMIVVVIIGILASTAVPLYHAYVNNAAASEASVNLVDIATKEEAHFATYKNYVYTSDHKITDISVPYGRESQRSAGSWIALGYPNKTADEGGIFGGPLYFRYSVNDANNLDAAAEVQDNGTPHDFTGYTVQARRKLSNNEIETRSITHFNPGAIITTTSTSPTP